MFLRIQLHRILTQLGVCLSLLVLTGCASTPAVVRKALPSPIVSYERKVLDPKLVKHALNFSDRRAYRVGPGDSLLVAVYGHPELSLATYAGQQPGGQNGRGTGLVIDNDGTIQFPLIGTVNVEGRTTEQLRKYLEQTLGRYIKSPQVTVQVLFAGSIRYFLLGEFISPGLRFSDRRLKLMEAMGLAGSINLEKASLRGAYVVRDNRRLPVNFDRLVRLGDMEQNIALQTGDVVVVPNNAADRVFVFGGVAGGQNGGQVPFINGSMSILQALAQAGFGFEQRAQGVLSRTHVIRSEGDRGELFIVNVERILKGKASNFLLMPGDVIYVPTNSITNWNLAIQQLLPSLNAVSALLNPFVQIQFLRESAN